MSTNNYPSGSWTLNGISSSTDDSGHPLGRDGRPIPTDRTGVPLDKDGQPLPIDSSGHYVTVPRGEEERVSEPSSAGLPESTAGVQRNCTVKNLKLDLVFAINTKDMTKTAFYNIMQAISQFADNVDLSPDVTRFGLIYGNKEIVVPLTLGGYQEKQHMREQIRRVVFTEDSSDDDVSIYDPVKQQFAMFPRLDASKIAIVIGQQLTRIPEDTNGIAHLYISPKKLQDKRSKQLELDKVHGSTFNQMIQQHCKRSPTQLPLVSQMTLEEHPKADSESEQASKAMGPDGQVLPTDESGYYIHPVVGPDGSPLPTDMHKRPIYPIVGKDGSPLPTDNSGAYISPDGRPIPTDSSGKPLGDDGSPLPTDASGNYVIAPIEEAVSKELPTDESGNVIYPIIIQMITVAYRHIGGNVIYPITKPDGSPLPTDTSGRYVTDEGTIIEKDRSGRPLGPDGQVLPTDESGYYIYPAVGPDGSPLPTDMHKRPIYPIVGKDGSPLPTDNSGAYISPDGRPIPTDSSGKPLGDDGSPLPTDASGNYVIAPIEEAVSKELPTDESGNVIYPITMPDGSPLPTDISGNYVTDEGTIIEKDDEGRPLGPDGQVLPTDESGYYIYPVVGPDGSPLPTDMHKRPIYPVTGKDGTPLPTDDSGAYIGPDGRPIPTDSSGKPLGEDGSPLPTDASGNYVTVPRSKTKLSASMPQMKTEMLSISVTMRMDHRCLRDICGDDGSPLQTDASGNYVIAPIEEAVSKECRQMKAEMLSILSPCRMDHRCLTDISGNYVTDEGTIIEKDDEGRPLGPDGQVLPTDESGYYIYPVVGPDGSPLPQTCTSVQFTQLLKRRKTTTDRRFWSLHWSGWTTNTNRFQRKASGERCPLHSNGCMRATIFTVPLEDAVGKQLPTDESGNVIYPVTMPDGSPLPTDISGNYVTDEALSSEKDDEGRPLRPDGQVLPTDESGYYIYPVCGPDGSPLPTDMHKRPIYPVVGKDGTPLPTDDSGAYIGPDGRPIPTIPAETSGRRCSPLPTDALACNLMSQFPSKTLSASNCQQMKAEM
ncbi:hypothetical protein COOONC_01157 [Cooperia oncophora]